jgi:iron(III) transport system permease protein
LSGKAFQNSLRLLADTAVLALLAAPAAAALLRGCGEPVAAWVEASQGLLGSRSILLLVKSGLFSTFVALLSMAGGLLLASAFLRWKKVGRKAWFLWALLPLPPYLLALVWSAAFFQISRFIGPGPLVLQGWSAAALTEVMAFLPFAAFLAWTAIRGLDADLLACAALLRPGTVVWLRVALPLATPVLAAGASVIFTLSLLDYTIPSLFAIQVYAMEPFALYGATGRVEDALAASVPLLILGGVATILGLRQFKVLSSRPGREPDHFGGALAASAGALLLGFQLVVLLGGLVGNLGTPADFVLAIRASLPEFTESLMTGLLAAMLAVSAGAWAARRIRARVHWAFLFWLGLVLGLALPAPLTGIGLLALRAWMPILPELAWPILAQTCRALPFCALVMFAWSLRRDPALAEAGRIFAPSSLQAILKIEIPLAAPAFALAFVLALAIAMGEIGATLLITVPGHSTLAIRLYNLLHYGASREASALALALLAPGLGFSVLALRAWRLIS